MRIHPYMSRRKPFTLKKVVAGDEQANKVYTMERVLVGMALYTRTDTRHMAAVISHASRHYKIAPPKLVISTDFDGGWYGHSFFDDNIIRLNAGYHGDNMFTMLHELGHIVADHKCRGEEDHGPTWVWYYAELLNQYKVLPLAQFLSLCDDCGVDYG